MSSLQHIGDPPAVRCALCRARDAAGPCARCRRSVCGDCCELTTGGATTFALCLTCVRRGGASLLGGWGSTLLWLGGIIAVLVTIALALVLARGA
jgi:hypothetical protein